MVRSSRTSTLRKAPFLFGCSAVRRFLEAKAIEEAEIKVDGAFRLEPGQPSEGKYLYVHVQWYVQWFPRN